MNRTVKLEHNLKYRLIKNTDFMARLHLNKGDDLPSKIDYINLAKQYLEIYKAIEQRLNEIINENTLYLSLFNKEPWTDRSQLLKNDIREMRACLSDSEKSSLISNDKIFPVAKDMIDLISSADPVTLFAFISLRCISDVNEGQLFKHCHQRMFLKDNVQEEFYMDIANQTVTLNQFINQAVLTLEEEHQFDKAVDSFCQLQIDLLNEMEEGRVLAEDNDNVTSLNYKEGCRFTLFALSALAATATITGVLQFGLQ